jgi:hypothetical protein
MLNPESQIGALHSQVFGDITPGKKRRIVEMMEDGTVN